MRCPCRPPARLAHDCRGDAEAPDSPKHHQLGRPVSDTDPQSAQPEATTARRALSLAISLWSSPFMEAGSYRAAGIRWNRHVSHGERDNLEKAA